MTDVFVIRNQHGHYWGKSKEWLDGSDNRAVLRTKHEDEAVNTLVELSTKDIELRGQVVAAELDQRNHPIIEPSEIPLPGEPDAEPQAGGAEPGPAGVVENGQPESKEVT